MFQVSAYPRRERGSISEPEFVPEDSVFPCLSSGTRPSVTSEIAFLGRRKRGSYGR